MSRGLPPGRGNDLDIDPWSLASDDGAAGDDQRGVRLQSRSANRLSLRAQQVDSESAWETAPAELADLSLSDILHDPSVRRALEDDEDSRQQIRLRDAPPGFRAVMGKLADENFVSYSALSRASLAHGLALLEAKDWFGNLRAAYERTRRDGMDRGDPDALARLNQTAHYGFQRSHPLSTTLDASRATAARISEAAMVCGMPRPKLAVIAVLMSLLTLRENNRRYRDVFAAETEAFERFGRRRTKELSLGDWS